MTTLQERINSNLYGNIEEEDFKIIFKNLEDQYFKNLDKTKLYFVPEPLNQQINEIMKFVSYLNHVKLVSDDFFRFYGLRIMGYSDFYKYKFQVEMYFKFNKVNMPSTDELILFSQKLFQLEITLNSIIWLLNNFSIEYFNKIK